MLHQRRLRILEVPARLRPRKSGRSQFTFFRGALYPARVTIGLLAILYKRSRKGMS